MIFGGDKPGKKALVSLFFISSRYFDRAPPPPCLSPHLPGYRPNCQNPAAPFAVPTFAALSAFPPGRRDGLVNTDS